MLSVMGLKRKALKHAESYVIQSTEPIPSDDPESALEATVVHRWVVQRQSVRSVASTPATALTVLGGLSKLRLEGERGDTLPQ